MGKLQKQDQSDHKSQLVSEICFMSTRSIGCVHRNRSSRPSKSLPFIDWYRVFGVEETTGVDVIRKKYHKLALQLHPDKNKHPKAEMAFKIVSEAYACLTDHAKRRAFDLERWKNFCFQCDTIPYTTTTTTHKTSTDSNAFPSDDKAKGSNWSSAYRILRGLKDKLREEVKVIENCLRTNAAASRKESSLFSPSDYLNSQSGTHKESPIFNPSDYAFRGYPHQRTRIQYKPDNFWYFLQAGHGLKRERGSEKCYDSPIFEVRSGRGAFRSKSACVQS
ncbi:hypothetical protein FNV43_RR00934 [Rhamnella rubrinervis]|uniref:J domain-containing protein n=1 Tax=Rhamnella rubrinervis TaxID=2594499 RepID=A0A8K0HRM6_9ROSA|nr:hypothetical protein FNV43_RR00934 [Rhamnella rubrinervis]